MTTSKDPVCGMNVEREKSRQQSQHHGQTYFFCSTDCKREFEKSPQRYAKQEPSGKK